MPRWSKEITISSLLQFCLGLFLFLLPWPTIYIIQEKFVNGYKWEYGTIGFYATEILLWVNVVLFIVWFIKKLKMQNEKCKIKFSFSKDRIFVLSILVFVLYGFASIFWAGDKEVAFQHALYILESALLFLMIYLGPMDFNYGAKWLIAGAVVQSILGIWQFLTQSTVDFKWLGLAGHQPWVSGTSVVESDSIGRWLRSYGSFSNPNVFGGYLAVSTFVTVVFFLLVRSAKMFLFLLALLCLQMMALFFTFSRSAWLAMIFVFLFHCYIAVSRKMHIGYRVSRGASMVFLVIILSLIFFPIVKTRFEASSVYEVRSVTERMDGYETAFDLFKQHPWLGVGLGNYTVELYNLNSSLPGWYYQPAHNIFLVLLVELGIVGLVILFLVFWQFFWLTWVLQPT